MQQQIAGTGQCDGNNKGAGLNFYKHYMGDYTRDTAHLSLAEHGAYRVLLDTYYATEQPLPAEKTALYRITKAMTPAERKAVDLVAAQFFPLQSDGLRHNQRADAEIANANAYGHAQSMRAQMRWHKQADMQAHMPDECPTDASHSHSQSKPKNNVLSDAFVSFWNSWPSGERKVAKGKCAAVWKRKNLDSSLTEILAHVAAMKGGDSWKGGYVPMPMTYLNESRWDGAEVTTNDWQKGVL